MDLNHLHLHVKDLTKSREFYARYFGFEAERLNEGDFVIVANSQGFDLALAQDAQSLSFPKWFHFGFHLPTKEAVREMYNRMLADGVKMKNDLSEESYITFRCVDPDGYIIEVYLQ